MNSIGVYSREFAANDPVLWAAQVLVEAGIENARFEAQLLLGLALGVSRAAVVARTYPEPAEEQTQRFVQLVAARARRVPLAYLRGTQEFYGLEFLVNAAVLIPRPETELLVDMALARLAHNQRGRNTLLFADAGTGSGCIPIAILRQRNDLCAIAVDISPAALGVAHTNARRLDVADRLRLVQSDLLSCVKNERFALVASNPPYIASSEIDTLQPEVAVHEPRGALDGGLDGLDMYRKLAQQAYRALCPGGSLLLEVGQGQAGQVTRFVQEAGFTAAGTERDLAGIERVVWAQKEAAS